MSGNSKDISNILNPISFKNDPGNFIELFPSGVFIIDENFIITNLNTRASIMLESGKPETIGKSIFEIFNEHDSGKLENIFHKSLQTGNQFTAELLINKFDERYINVLAAISSFNNLNTDARFYVIAIIDHTPQKMKEEIIKQSEARFKNLANTAPVMIWIADAQGLFSFVNTIWLDYTGGDSGDQLGLNWIRRIHPDDVEQFLNQYQKAIGEKSSFTLEFRFMGKQKTYEWMLFKGKPRFSEEKIFLGFLGSCFSINEQKEIEARVNKMNEELKESNATKDKFFSIISHDMRSPLSGLMGILELLNESYDSMSEKEKKEIIADVVLSSKTTYTLVENLLEWSRIQSRKIEIQPERIDLMNLLNNIALIYDQSLKIKRIRFSIDVEPGLISFADKAVTETILRNLISNAIKFSYSGGVITVSAECEDNKIVIIVSDQGVGIDERTIQNLFRVDVNSSTKGTENETGSGLGLIICKELVEMQNGEIWVKSKKNEGTNFYFTLPSVG